MHSIARQIPRQCTRAWKHRLKPTHMNMFKEPVRDVHELKQHLIETWSATSRASLIKRLISGKIVLMHVSKSKTNIEHLKIMFFRNCHDLNTTIRKGGQFCCSFVASLLQYLCTKNYRNITWFDKVTAKIKGCNFLPRSVEL